MTSSAEVPRTNITSPKAAAALLRQVSDVSKTENTSKQNPTSSEKDEVVVLCPVKSCKHRPFNHYTVREGSLSLPFVLTFASDQIHPQSIRTIMVDRNVNISMVEGELEEEVLNAFFSVEASIKRDEVSIDHDTLYVILEREELGGGVYTTTTVSATGQGLHKRWHYPEPNLKASLSDTSLIEKHSQSPVVVYKEEPMSPTLAAISLNLPAPTTTSASTTANSFTSTPGGLQSLKRRYDGELNDEGDGASQQNKRRRGLDIPNIKAESSSARSRHGSRHDTSSTKSSKMHSTSNHVHRQKDEEIKALDRNPPKLSPGPGSDAKSRRESYVEDAPQADPLTLANLLDDLTVLSGAHPVRHPPSGPLRRPETSNSQPSHYGLGVPRSVDAARKNKRSSKCPRDHEYDADEERSSEEDRPKKIPRKIDSFNPATLDPDSFYARPKAAAHSSPASATVPAKVEAPSTFLAKAKSASPSRVRHKASRVRSVDMAPQ